MSYALLPREARIMLMNSYNTTGNPNASPGDILLSQQAYHEKPFAETVFGQSYVHLDDAQRDYAQVLRNLGRVENVSNTCVVLMPLLVKFAGEKDAYIPVRLGLGAELQKTIGVPDMLISFHSESKAITVSVCEVQKERILLFRTAIDCLYSMTADRPLTILNFQRLYDDVRLRVLKANTFRV